MKNIKYKYLNLFILSLLVYSCLPDRVPTEPIENTRPKFVSFHEASSSKLAIPLDASITMIFNEKMDVNTFGENVTVESISGKISGSFSIDQSIDTAVIFQPSGNYNPAEYYTVSVSGAIQDINGNSMIAPHEEDVPQTTWFFSSGEYSGNGFPFVFVRDKSSKQVIYRVGQLDEYKDSLFVEATEEDYQTASIEFSPVGNYLYMVNLKITNSTVTVIDPSTFAKVKTIEVGQGPTNIAFSGQKAFVINTSGKSFSVFDINSLEAETTFEFTDGFKPKDAVYSSAANKLFFYSSNKKQIKVVDAANYENSYILDSVLIDKKAVDIEITNDGQFIYLPESKTGKVLVLNANTDKIEAEIETGYGYNIDGAMGKDFYYLAFFKKVNRENIGGIAKIDVQSHSLVNVMTWDKDIDAVKLTKADELLYAVSPVDSTVQIIETSTLKNIASTKISGSLKYLAVSKNNYQ